jgi:Cu2+-exporting ATPase
VNAPARITVDDGVCTSLFNVPAIHCAGCIAKIERGLVQAQGISGARVNFTAKRVRIEHDGELGEEAIQGELRKLGFPSEPLVVDSSTPANRESQRLLRALGVAGFASMNVMLLSVSVWSGATGATRDLFHFLSGLIAIPAVAYSGRPFFSSAWNALKAGRTNMDVPISIGVLMACAISIYETAISGPHAYFDGAVTLLFFLLAGRALDQAMRSRAEDGAAALLRRMAHGAWVRTGDGGRQWRPAEELAPGMVMLVAAGDRLAADGKVTLGQSAIDRSLITGESAPEPVTAGSAALAGTLNLDAPIEVKVTAAGESTTIAEIARLMEAAGGSRSRYVRLADRAARFYAPAVHSLAALSLVVWLLIGAGLHQSVLVAVAVLIITCPCALGLAVPVSHVVAAGSLMRAGVLLKDGSALERLAEVDVALFDKTGTLTLGRPVPVGELGLGASEKNIALALAAVSRHPVARALAEALERDGVVPAELSAIREHPGLGVAATCEGVEVRLGRPSWTGAAPAGQGEGVLLTSLAIGKNPPRILAFRDRLRADAGAAVLELSRAGLCPTILSGDREEPVRRLAGQLGVEARPELLPQDKVALIDELQAAGRRVLMVGDGLNDGPALRAAHVSIAPSSATDVSQIAADVLVLGDSMMPVALALRAARRTSRVVRQNFAVAIGYNLIAVPLAFAGMVTPLVAAISMSASSILVVANSLRLRNAAR